MVTLAELVRVAELVKLADLVRLAELAWVTGYRPPVPFSHSGRAPGPARPEAGPERFDAAGHRPWRQVGVRVRSFIERVNYLPAAPAGFLRGPGAVCWPPRT